MLSMSNSYYSFVGWHYTRMRLPAGNYRMFSHKMGNTLTYLQRFQVWQSLHVLVRRQP